MDIEEDRHTRTTNSIYACILVHANMYGYTCRTINIVEGFAATSEKKNDISLSPLILWQFFLLLLFQSEIELNHMLYICLNQILLLFAIKFWLL